MTARLAKRLAACRTATYSEYFHLLTSGDAPLELQMAVDLLTTNETYFFRESKHFDFLQRQVRAAAPGPGSFRVWSAAASSGEEAYSIAMVLEDHLPGRWEVVGSDISARVLERARHGRYKMERISYIPQDYLRRFCLKGVDGAAGTLLIEPYLRSKVQFQQINLNAPLPKLGAFDVIFLRNVMIYFNVETKRRVVERILAVLKPGGYLLVGHSETLASISSAVTLVAPATYRKNP